MDALLRCLVALEPPAAADLPTWWQATAAIRDAWEAPVDRALLGGGCADRLGFAFASGYAEALRILVPTSSELTALCATEERGNHPRAIQTRLVPADGGGYLLSGRKRWATMASAASWLLVVASTGTDAEGKNRLRVARVATGAPGVHIRPSTAPFIPEIPHAEVELDGVAVDDAQLLPGDGYDLYLKPFRTIEDIQVHAALAGYLIGVARRHRFPHATLERLIAIAVATRAIAAVDRSAATTHVALAGVFDLLGAAVADVERCWVLCPDDEWTRWLRDRPLLGVAGTARSSRRERAWQILGSVSPDLLHSGS